MQVFRQHIHQLRPLILLFMLYGWMVAIMSERSGFPPDNETAALPERQKVLKENFNKSTLIVFPLRAITISGISLSGNREFLLYLLTVVESCYLENS